MTDLAQFARMIEAVVRDTDRGITLRQIATLLLVYRDDPESQTMSNLALALNLDNNVVTRAVGRLATMSLVVRERSRADRRVVHARLTKAGAEYVARLAAAVRSAAT